MSRNLASFTGDPCSDLDGGLRLRDYDGDGVAKVDIGAYEHENTTLMPGLVTGLAWTNKTTLRWDGAAPPAVEYHAYRGALADLGYANFGTCNDGLLNPSDTELTDTELPASGAGFFYLITIREEGTLGFAACAERSNFTPCVP